MGGSACTSRVPLLVVFAAAVCANGGSAHLYAAGLFFQGGDVVYSVGKLNLSSSSSARTLDPVHSWSPKDLPGMGTAFCGPSSTVL